MSNFLTVKEAVERTGLSDSAIRRVIHPILKADSHADRHFIEPTVADAQAMRLKGENFAWRISVELLDREMQERAKKAKPESKSTAGGSTGNDYLQTTIEMLRNELQIKNQQIESQAQLLRDFSERVREANFMIGSLQKQIAPAAPRQEPVDASAVGDREGDAEARQHPVDATSPKKRHWLFRKVF